MFRKTSLLLIVSVIFCLTACNSSEQINNEADHAPGLRNANVSWAQSYSNIDELTSDSFVDFIVVGEIEEIIEVTKKKEGESSIGPVYSYFTDFSFNIERVLKGKDILNIVIHQTGAPGEIEIKDDPLFKPGEKYILFLHEYTSGKSFVVGGPDGRFKIIDDRVFTMNYILPPDTYWPDDGLDTNGVLMDDFIETISEKVTAIEKNL